MKETQKLDFAIIGVQKSASTTLQHWLQKHPSLFLLDGEKACFETPDFERNQVKYPLDFSKAEKNALLGIKRPKILHDATALYRLKMHAPEIKVIIILRDPVDRFISAYFHLMRYSQIPVLDINKSILEMFHGNYLSKFPMSQTLLLYGLYHPHLEILRGWFNSDRFLILTNKEMKERSLQTLKRVTDFLGVDPMSVPVGSDLNVAHYNYNIARVNLLANIFSYKYSAGRLRLEVRRNKLFRKIGSGVSLIGKNYFKNHLNSNKILTDESLKLLRQYYQNDKDSLISSTFKDKVYW